ncbi:carboxylesterase/lipase family protein [Kribbella catacumbae]|uniref:carboxylesterase/lipase family protein n=1 Tax=Kribbella catacumbae TaxID=460086 RepID=UPI0003AAD8AC|nr:carboxylesterase family protein [Kribbella catacumbae]
MRWRTTAAVVALGLGLSGGTALPTATAGAGQDQVQTSAGPVRGLVGDKHREFLGIPYAAPPVGERRWASPSPVQPWTAPRDATERPADCPQSPFLPGLPGSTTEDCLYLNVTTPRRTGQRLRPVMVFIHGGGFQWGSGRDHDPTELAVTGDVVVVTINYRLGVLGFLTHPALDGGPALRRSGAFGLEDQQAALRWVRDNAAAFGGDAGRVTIFGESSGGRSVCALLATPSSAGLFHRAIIQSDPCTAKQGVGLDGTPEPTSPGTPLPRPKGETQGRVLAQRAGCDVPDPASCLRDKSVQQLLAAVAGDEPDGSGLLFLAPVFGDGGLLPVDPEVALRTGRFAKVPVMHGITRNELRFTDALLEGFGLPALTPDEYVNRVRRYVGANRAAEVLARYPIDGRRPSEAWGDLTTDALLARPHVELNRILARHVPTYAFEFADPATPWLDSPHLQPPSSPPGAYHTGDLQYLFQTAGYPGPQTAKQERLSGQMMRYWSQFAHTGNPNGARPIWPHAGLSADLALQLAPGPHGIRSINFSRQHQVAFWETLDLD